MLYLDDRVGSRDLLPFLHVVGMSDVEETRLEYGDCCWSGEGEHGTILVGVERKRLQDLVSSMRDRRLAGHQLPGLHSLYGCVYLIIEGVYRPGKGGEVDVLRGRNWSVLPPGVSYKELDSFLNSLSLRGGCHVVRTNDEYETAMAIAVRYQSWQVPWEQHRAHEQIYAPVPSEHTVGHRASLTTRSSLDDKEQLCAAVAAQLPGVDSKCFNVAKYFHTVRRMVLAHKDDWMRVKGIGKTGADKIMEVIG